MGGCRSAVCGLPLAGEVGLGAALVQIRMVPLSVGEAAVSATVNLPGRAAVDARDGWPLLHAPQRVERFGLLAAGRAAAILGPFLFLLFLQQLLARISDLPMLSAHT